MQKTTQQWLQLSCFNLLLVAGIGVILRYKILFSLPLFDQKHLLQGHSNFAFSGWITQTLLVLLVHHISQIDQVNYFPKYQKVLYANLITAYGMLLSFPLQGYGFWSISFSTLSILSNYVFIVMYWKDLSKRNANITSSLFIKSALLFNIISSIGAFALTYLMANKIFNQNAYLAAVYFFLHFQYNGWFSFVILGLVAYRIERIDGIQKKMRIIFWLFSIACIPAYLLSALWLPFPLAIYWMVVAAAFAQILGLFMFSKLFFDNRSAIEKYFPKNGQWLFILSSIAFAIKLLLQLGSTIPSLSQLAFGFRPIVIGYLHLILLGVITISLLGFIYSFHLVEQNKMVVKGIMLFVAGIILNEILLMTQGVAALSYQIIPYINECLLITAILMFSGLVSINLYNRSIKINQLKMI